MNIMVFPLKGEEPEAKALYPESEYAHIMGIDSKDELRRSRSIPEEQIIKLLNEHNGITVVAEEISLNGKIFINFFTRDANRHASLVRKITGFSEVVSFVSGDESGFIMEGCQMTCAAGDPQKLYQIIKGPEGSLSFSKN